VDIWYRNPTDIRIIHISTPNTFNLSKLRMIYPTQEDCGWIHETRTATGKHRCGGDRKRFNILVTFVPITKCKPRNLLGTPRIYTFPGIFSSASLEPHQKKCQFLWHYNTSELRPWECVTEYFEFVVIQKYSVKPFIPCTCGLRANHKKETTSISSGTTYFHCLTWEALVSLYHYYSLRHVNNPFHNKLLYVFLGSLAHKYAIHNTSEHKLHATFKQFYRFNKIMIKIYGNVVSTLNCARRHEEIWSGGIAPTFLPSALDGDKWPH
jgi:hypothetical protein